MLNPNSTTFDTGSLPETARVHHFSDCAYIEASSPKDLSTYLRAVRSELMILNVFVRGAIGRGKLMPFGGRTTKLDKSGKVTGIYFGADVVPIYRLESSLKGIGLRVDDTCIKPFKNELVSSFFFSDYGKRNIVCFQDLRFDKTDLTDFILRSFLEKFLITNTRSQRIGRYYVSFLATWIQSHDLSGMKDKDLENLNETESSVPLIIK